MPGDFAIHIRYKWPLDELSTLRDAGGLMKGRPLVRTINDRGEYRGSRSIQFER